MNDFDLDQAEKEIEISIAEAEAAVDMGIEVEKLTLDPLFDKIITQGYLTNQAVRLTSLLAEPDMQSAEEKASIHNDLYAISAFQKYLRTIITKGKQMSQQIAASEAELDSLRNEMEGE